LLSSRSQKDNKRDTKYYKKVGGVSRTNAARQNIPLTVQNWTFWTFWTGSADEVSVQNPPSVGPISRFSAQTRKPFSDQSNFPFASIPLREKSNKTERFRNAFDFDHAVPSTYDDALPGRSILASSGLMEFASPKLKKTAQKWHSNL
jgi:hypothetical protein